MVCPDACRRFFLLYGVCQRRWQCIAANAIDQLSCNALHAFRARVHFIMPAAKRWVADEKAGRVIYCFGRAQAAGVIGDHQKVEWAFQLCLQPAGRGDFFTACKAQRIFWSQLYAKTKGVDGICRMQMGVAP